jgi:hypothetical protein
MGTAESIFFNFVLPNDTTWFYFSLLLAVALFFKFGRLLSIRNLDVLTLFLLVPGLLLLRENRSNWIGYLWLLCGSGYFLVRCFLDLSLVRRPALNPNLNLSGLAWLAGALFVCLVTVAFRQPGERLVGKESVSLDQVQRQVENRLQQQAATSEPAGLDTRAWVKGGLAVFCHFAIVAGLVFIGCRHFQDAHAGMAAATFYLLLPYTAYHVGQVHHVWPIALMVWAVALYRLPALAGLLLGLAAGSVYFPVVAFPIWFSFYWRRGAGRFTGAFALAAGLCLAAIGIILWLDNELSRSIQSAVALPDWQPFSVPTAEGFWQGVHWAYRIPVFISYLTIVLATALWPSPKNLAQVLALTAALLIGFQFWYADQGGVYVLWYLPLLLLLVFRPNLSERRPLPIQPETDWLARLGRTLLRWVERLLKPPAPLTPVR